MADHSSPLHLDAEKERVAITIGLCGDYAQAIARTFPFRPELVASATEKGHVAFGQGSFERLRIHKSDHENGSVSGVLNHGGQKARQFIEIEICVHETSLSRRNKKPAEAHRVSGPEFMIADLSQLHPRPHAMCVMVMMVVAMR
jgi:hypothetical protein